MSDEELDAHFRRIAESYPDDIHPGAWERMEMKLDAAQPNAGQRAQQLRQKIARTFAIEAAMLLLVVWQVYRLVPFPTEAPLRLPTATSATIFPAAARQPVERSETTSRGAANAVSVPAYTGAGSTAAAPAGTSSAARTTAEQASPAMAAAVSAAQPGAPNPVNPARTVPPAGSHPIPIVVGLSPLPRSVLPSHSPEKHAASAPVISAERPRFNQMSPALAIASGARRRQQKSAPGLSADAPQTRLIGQPTDRTNGVSRRNTGRRPKAGAEEATVNRPEVGLEASTGQRPGRLALLPTRPTQLRGAASNLTLADSLQLPTLTLLPADSVVAPARHAAARPAYRVVVGLLGAPSISAVRTLHSAQLGGDYGLTLEYRFTQRLRLRAGLISSQKRYRAASTDYQAPAAWNWYPGDYQLDAECRISEIPLDLRYDVLTRPGFSLFTSLGLNSLLMRDERYSYDAYANGQQFYKEVRVVNGSRHLLSVLNVAVGVERPLSGRWSAQVEPFWQFPLGGVGAGQVRLSSAGADFSLKYGLFR